MDCVHRMQAEIRSGGGRSEAVSVEETFEVFVWNDDDVPESVDGSSAKYRKNFREPGERRIAVRVHADRLHVRCRSNRIPGGLRAVDG